MAKHANLQKGDVVTIYHDPIAQEDPEGKAQLLKQQIDDSQRHGPGAGYWKVKFANGDVANRWVYLY